MPIAFPKESRDHILDVVLHNGVKTTEWYVALFEGNYTPQDSDTAANIGGRATEITSYAESTRPALTFNPPANGEINNAGGLAQVTMTATKTIRALGIVSSAAKGSTSGKLLAFQKLAVPVTYNNGDIVKVPVTLSALNLA